MMLFKEDGHHNTLKLFYNKKHIKGYFVVENASSILKKNFKELMCRSNLSVTFLCDLFTCCLLHKLLKTEDEESIKRLFHIINLETNNSHEDKPVIIVQDDQPSNQ
jgi:hypothetical protein